jgi:hypothetical protein
MEGLGPLLYLYTQRQGGSSLHGSRSASHGMLREPLLSAGNQGLSVAASRAACAWVFSLTPGPLMDLDTPYQEGHLMPVLADAHLVADAVSIILSRNER